LAISSLLGNHTVATAQQTIENEIGAADANALADSVKNKKASDEDVRAAFQEFVGKTFYGQLLKSMRQSMGKPAYFHGGRGEEVFQSQLDQLVVERIAETSAGSLADSLYDLTALSRR
jgi:hypothetical protein